MKRNIHALSACVFRVALVTGLFSFPAAGLCHAQLASSQHSSVLLASDVGDSIAAPALPFADQPLSSETELPAAVATPPTAASPQVGEPTSDWHFAVSPYLWLPGVHGTIGARDHDASIHATPGDLLSNLRFGLMGLVDVQYKRIIVPLDIMWVRLGTNNALALTDDAVTARIRADEFILTQKIGYRLIDTEMIKIDALAGFRYWHFGESLSFSPSDLGIKFSASQNWVDPLVGGRITGFLSPKVVVTIAGDVGGWGTGSQLDYQIAGFLGYRIKPAVILQAGYRYLSVDYRSGGSKIDMVTSGAVIGATFTLK
jgi:hypothetical protein